MEEIRNTNGKVAELSDDRKVLTIKRGEATTIVEAEDGSPLKYKNL